MADKKFIKYLNKEEKKLKGYDVKTNIEDISKQSLQRLFSICNVFHDEYCIIKDNKPNEKEMIFINELCANDYIDYELEEESIYIYMNANKLNVIHKNNI